MHICCKSLFWGSEIKKTSLLLLFSVVIIIPVFSDSFMHQQTETADDMKIWYERADLEETRDFWLITAGSGFSHLSYIEREKSLNEMKKRLYLWQWKKIEEGITPPDIQALLSEIDSKKDKYLYILEEAKLKKDENGKPLFKGLSDLDNDISSWEEELKYFINKLFTEWEDQAAVNYDEIILREKEIGKEEKSFLDVSFSEYRENIRREFEDLYLAGRKNFLMLRSRDSFSMKKESEDKRAGVEAEKRIEEVQASLKNASESLENNLSIMKSINSLDAGMKINEWEEDFKNSFEKGLDKWEKAEKDFLTERIRWEKSGKEGYIKAETEWDSAIEKFTAARKLWSAEMKGIINDGRQYWKKREVSFFESYENVTEGIEKASLKEKIRFEKELSGYLYVYRESRNVESMAEENIKYLNEEIARIDRYKNDKQKTAGRLKKEIDRLEKEIRFFEKIDDDSIFGRLFKRKAEENKAKLIPLNEQYTHAVQIRDCKNDELIAYKNELVFWEKALVNYKNAREGAERNLLALEEGIKSSVYGGNEFDSELNILREKRDILKRKLDIAQHVYEYSLDNTSERERKAETEKNCREALNLFKEKEKSYKNRIKELDYFIENILSMSEKEIEEKKAVLNSAERKFEEAGSEYEAAMDIFRLKDSSLLETTISNLEEENRYYLEKELEDTWGEYFINMECLLGNEKKWRAEDLLEDIRGSSDEDNAEDFSRYEDRYNYLESLNPDFSNSDTADLKNEFTLKGFDIESGLINKFFVSLEDSCEDKAFFYFHLVKIQYRGELDTINKGMELLCLNESNKSSSELKNEIEDTLKAKRAFLFGDEYDHRDILFFLDEKNCDNTVIDTTDPDVLENIKQIALLEAEIKAIDKYCAYSAAFTCHERKTLFKKLASLYFLADDGETASVGISASFETKEDLIYFYKDLKTLDVPVYLEEITGIVLEGIIREKGFFFDEDLTSMKNVLESYNKRIENYTVSDSLTLRKLEEKRDELSIELDTITDLKSCYNLSLVNEYSGNEKNIYEALIVKALQTLRDEPSVITSEDTVKEKKNLISSSRVKFKERSRKLTELRSKLKQWETEQAEYFKDNIADKKSFLETAKAEIAKLRTEYHDLLNNFTSLTNQYREKKKAVDVAFSEFTMSKWKLYEAEELKDFAHSPYALKNTDPDAVLDIRKSEFEKADNLYNEILNIKNNFTQSTIDERYNTEYLETLKEKKELISSVNYLGHSSDILSHKVLKVKEEAGRFYSVMKDSIGSIFKFTLPFKPDIENFNNNELTDFTEYEKEEDLLNAVTDYFNSRNSSITFSNDTLKWAEAVSDSGSHTLKNFGIAFYAEYGKKVTVPVYSDQNYNELRRGKYADCNPKTYTDSCADKVLAKIKADPESYKLYSFFKAMHLSGNTSLDYSFMGKDVSRIAHDYLWKESKKEERHIRKKHWWSNFWKRTAGKMKRMRHNMCDVNGNYERGIIWGDIEKTFSARDSFLEKKDEIRILTGGEEGETLSFEDFIISLNTVSGGLPDEAGEGFKALLKSIYDSSTEEDRQTSCLLSIKIFQKLNERLRANTAHLYNITANLERERNLKLLDYRASLDNPDVNSNEIKDSFIRLFYESEYSLNESSPISFSKILSSYSDENDLKGRERILSFAADDLMKYFSSSIDIKKHENNAMLNLQYQELKDKQGLFENRIAELYEAGVREWKAGFTNLVGKRKKWRENFQKEAGFKEELWKDKYNILKANRSRWIEKSVLAVERGESRRLSREIGINADKLLSESEMVIIPDIKNIPDLENIIENVTDSKKLSSLISAADYFSSGKESDSLILSAYLPEIGSFSGSDKRLESYAENISNKVRKHAAILEALKMAKTVTQVEDGILENIKSANRSTEKSLADTLEGKGYRKKGNSFSRKAIIDMTLVGGIEEELHEIEAYHNFTAPDFDIGVDLSKNSLSSMGYEEIELNVEKAVTNLRRYSDLIFGGKTSKESANWRGFDEDFKSRVEKAEKSFTSSCQASKYKDTKGLFYMHIGYAPVMKSKDPEKVKTAGYGEYGRIYKYFLRNEARLGRGLASLDQPWYSQKLWDDDKDNDGESDGLFGAPSVRSIGNIAMTVVSGGAGMWAFAVNMIDDVTFTAMDMSSGITDWDDGLMSLGKQAGIGSVSQGIGGFEIETDSFLASASYAGLKTASTNIAGTAINSFELSGGGIKFSDKTFKDNWKSDLYGKNAVSGYITSMGTAGLNSTLTGFYGNDLKYGKALSSTAAETAAGIYEYNALGSTKLNVLNSSELFFWNKGLQDKFGGTGLLELGIGGNGSLFNLGTEGQNVGTTQIASAYKGIKTHFQNARIRLSQKENIAKARVAMRALYSRGRTDEASSVLYSNLLSGKDNLVVKSCGSETAETEFNNNGGRTIRVESLGKDRISRLRLGTVLGHEAHRDGTDNGVYGQAGETLQAVLAHTEMAIDMERDYSGLIASDRTLSNDAAAYKKAAASGNLKSFAGYVFGNYDISKDFWKVLKHRNGSISMTDDGSDDVVVIDENTGEEKKFEYSGGSKTAFIADVLGLSRDEVNYQMGPQAGWSYIDGEWENKLDNKTVEFSPEQIEKMNIRFKQLKLLSSRSAVKEGIFRNIKNVFNESKNWISGKYAAVREIFSFKRYIASKTVADPLSENYYARGDILPTEVISGGNISQTAHEEDKHLLPEWYTKGHPAVDITGKGMISFPYDLELLKTGKNRNRLLYRISGSDDYIYFTHINPSESDALQKILEKSGSKSVLYKAGTSLFSYPKEVDKYSTDLHIHMEMYRQKNDGSYSFADPLTGDFLPEFRYMHGKTINEYTEWIKKLPSKRNYWK